MINMLKQDREEFCILGKKLLSNTCSFPKVQSLQILYKDVFLIEQARKAQRCDSFLQSETITHPLTDPLTGVGARRCYRI